MRSDNETQQGLRENCCDDIAAEACGDRKGYADALVGMASTGNGVRGVAAAATGGKLLPRIRRIVGLGEGSSHGKASWLAAAVVIVALAMTGMIVVARLAAGQTSPADGGAQAPATQPGEERPRQPRRRRGFGGRVADRQTGNPVRDFVLQEGWWDATSPNRIIWGGVLGSSRHRRGRFYLKHVQAQDPRLMRILANGYLPHVLKDGPIAEPAKVEETVVRLERGRRVQGRVLDHTGRPVREALVILGGRRRIRLVNGGAGLPSRRGGPRVLAEALDGHTRTRTDADGRFALTGIADDTTHVVVSHPTVQCWVNPLPKRAEELTVKLPEPAELEIRYHIPGAPDPGDFWLLLRTNHLPGWDRVLDSCTQTTEVRNSGKALLSLAPGSYVLARRVETSFPRFARRVVCERRSLVLEAGKTAEARFLVGVGSRISGGVHGLREAGALDAYVEVLPADAAGDSRKVIDVTVCGADGQFRTALIPAGTYVVAAKAYPPQRWAGPARPVVLGTAKVTVPAEGEAPSVRIVIKPGQHSPLCRAAPDFETKTVDGTRLRLREYRGKYVLLVFWTTRCAVCKLNTPYLREVYKAFGEHDRFVMIGLSLDKDLEAPKKYVARHGLKWIQGFLGDPSKTEVPGEYGVHSVPAIFLIDPHGRIIAAYLPGPAIKQTVAKALSAAATPPATQPVGGEPVSEAEEHQASCSTAASTV